MGLVRRRHVTSEFATGDCKTGPAWGRAEFAFLVSRNYTGCPPSCRFPHAVEESGLARLAALLLATATAGVDTAAAGVRRARSTVNAMNASVYTAIAEYMATSEIDTSVRVTESA